MNIALCGMMGCGKSTVAKVLARKYGLKTADTDKIIVERYGEINKIFAEHGEEYFRDIETQVTKEVAQSNDNTVISLGGGCVLRQCNVDYLKATGKIIFLKANLESLVKRVGKDTSRPLLKGGAREKLASLIVTRTPIYEGVADYIIDTDNLSPNQVAAKIMELIK
jgi:shikimate kinase